MSLAAFLLGNSKPGSGEVHIDKDLDALFNASPLSKPQSSVSHKRKRGQETRLEDKVSPKKLKRVSVGVTVEDEGRKPKSEKRTPADPQSKRRGKGRKSIQAASDTSTDGESGLENAYVRKTEAAGEKDQEDGTDEDEDEVPIHESLAGQDERKGRHKYVPEDETPAQRDARTIFVGNVPILVAQKKSALKQFRRHILSLVPTAKIESVRFRSIAFQKATSKLPTDGDDDDNAPSSQEKPDDPKPRILARASAWREQGSRMDAHQVDAPKQFLTPQQKKKIAFIKHEFHTEADSVNAYVVFAHSDPSHDQQTPSMDPYAAASMAATKCDRKLFMERMLRVDAICGDGDSARGEPRLSIFVGNLDFASREEDVRAFFEALVLSERGSPPDDEGGEDGHSRHKGWVTRVRIVRDKDTQLGKGFAYVQFLDRECVDDILSLEESKLKFAKRKLRVERCKAKPSVPSTRPSLSRANKRSPSRPESRKKVPMPKGDPHLGEKIAHLSKEARKEVKSSDPNRTARRLAKKKVRLGEGLRRKPQVKGSPRKFTRSEKAKSE